MRATKSRVKLPLTGLLTSVAASLCCITPILALFSGMSGLASSFSWLEAYRPYLIGISIVALGFAWYQQLKPRKAKDDCGCEAEKISFWQGKRFLAIITVAAALMMTLPAYTHLFYKTTAKAATPVATLHTKAVAIHIEGMTCASCEQHVNNELASVKGISHYQTSYDAATSHVQFDSTQTSIAEIVNAINKTGYTVTDFK